MGVAQLVFALISTSHQAAPGRVQLSAFLLDVVHCLWVGLNQTFRCLAKRVHLGVKHRMWIRISEDHHVKSNSQLKSSMSD